MVLSSLPPFSGSRCPLVGHWSTMCFLLLLLFRFFVFTRSVSSKSSQVFVGNWVSKGVVATRVGGYFSLCNTRCSLKSNFITLCLLICLLMLFYSDNIWHWKTFI